MLFKYPSKHTAKLADSGKGECYLNTPVNILQNWQIVAKVSAIYTGKHTAKLADSGMSATCIYTSKHTARMADSGKGECYL